jgi:pimeloyl-ACP methyl ester carboxylesterase
MLKKTIIFIFCAFSLFAGEEKENVICLHGFMGASWNMDFLAKSLKKDGWEVLIWKYKSRDSVIQEHGTRLADTMQSLAQKNPGKPIHFVAHSMGSLVLLSALNHPDCPLEAKMGKIILIAPPLKGSAWGRWLSQFSLARWIAKDFSGKQLMTKEEFDDLGTYPDSCKKMIIAGSLGFNPFISGANDGTVAVAETLLDMPHKRILVKRGHKTIVFSKKVARCVRSFLKDEEN